MADVLGRRGAHFKHVRNDNATQGSSNLPATKSCISYFNNDIARFLDLRNWTLLDLDLQRSVEDDCLHSVFAHLDYDWIDLFEVIRQCWVMILKGYNTRFASRGSRRLASYVFSSVPHCNDLGIGFQQMDCLLASSRLVVSK